jgi:hypothetical protein
VPYAAAARACVGEVCSIGEASFAVPDRPTCRLADVETIIAAWVHWYNTTRLMHGLGRRLPAEHQANYFADNRDDQPVAHIQQRVHQTGASHPTSNRLLISRSCLEAKRVPCQRRRMESQAGSSSCHPRLRVDGSTRRRPDLVVEVWSGGVASGADLSDHVARGNMQIEAHHDR